MDLEAVNRTLAATVRKQEEEIKVLRAALKDIANGHVREVFAVQAVARAALGGNNGNWS